MIYRNSADSLAVSLLLLRANYLQTPFIRGSALIEWTERKVMTFRWKLSVTWNKVVKTASRGSIDLRVPRLRLSVSGCAFGQTTSAYRLGIGADDQNQREKTVIFQAKPSQIFRREEELLASFLSSYHAFSRS